jgi:hypothetical protein
MTVLLLIIIVIILLIFLGGKILEELGKLLEFIVTAIAYIIKGIVLLIKKLVKRRGKPKAEPEVKKVIAYCPCSNSFPAEPRKENGWLVQCPACGRTLRVDTSKKKN